MERGTRFFWFLITALLGASLFFGLSAETRRRGVQASKAAEVGNGEMVQFVRAVDGDSIVVTNEAGEKVSVRLLGIKAFSPEGKDAAATAGRVAAQALETKLKEKPVRISLHSTPKDKHGRAIAELYVGADNIGLQLVEEGVVLTYTVYPFPLLTRYLEEQEGARAAQKGLWANGDLVKKADLLAREWARSRE